MPKIDEFYPFIKDGAHAAHTIASACAAGAPALRERNHNFRHFSSF